MAAGYTPIMQNLKDSQYLQVGKTDIPCIIGRDLILQLLCKVMHKRHRPQVGNSNNTCVSYLTKRYVQFCF